MCLTISSRDGFGFLFNSPAAAMIIPEVQKPHCIASAFRNASCNGCNLPSFSKPSIVAICLPLTRPTGVTQERAGRPDLGEPRGGDPAGLDDHLRDDAVDGPERRGSERHPVAEPGVPL